MGSAGLSYEKGSSFFRYWQNFLAGLAGKLGAEPSNTAIHIHLYANKRNTCRGVVLMSYSRGNNCLMYALSSISYLPVVSVCHSSVIFVRVRRYSHGRLNDLTRPGWGGGGLNLVL
jgi:hypothetical protein